MGSSLKTTVSPAVPQPGQAALVRALMLERFGGAIPSAGFDLDGHDPGVSTSLPTARPQRRRYRGWALASGRRR
jgi:hypothetical protein